VGPALAAKIEACRHCLPSGQEQGVHDGTLLLVVFVVFVVFVPEHWGGGRRRKGNGFRIGRSLAVTFCAESGPQGQPTQSDLVRQVHDHAAPFTSTCPAGRPQ
jgi:hypothetical protein